MIRRPQTPTLFPYTTLFRSRTRVAVRRDRAGRRRRAGRRAGAAEIELAHDERRLDDVAQLAHVAAPRLRDRKSTRQNSSHMSISYAVFCLKKKRQTPQQLHI